MTAARIDIGIVGAGAVASAFVRALAGVAERVTVWARRPQAAAELVRGLGPSVAAEPDLAAVAARPLILIAVSDGALPEVARQLSGVGVPSGAVVLHTSGLLTGASGLAPLAGDAILGSVHPLIAIARGERDPRGLFAGMPFAVEASEPRGEAAGAELVACLGGERIALPAGDIEATKARYHALATLVATGVVTLVDRAAASLAAGASQGAGVDRDALRRAYARLAESAARNVLAGAGPDVLTGALARGDESTVDAHHAALAGDPLGTLYRSVEREARRMLDEGDQER